jgi:NAD(P)-dependent dehydrogenase (short-subunit alcohol dehydrogenase family)
MTSTSSSTTQASRTPTPVLSGDTANLRRELEVNLFGPLAVTSAFADRLADRSGAVVNVASVLFWIGLGGSYSVSKAALRSATDSMRLDLTPRGVQVVGVYMGYVDTDMASGVDAPKTAPADVVRQVLDGLEGGASEVLAGEAAPGARDSRPARRRALRGRALTRRPDVVQIAGRTVLVTGASRGLGRELVVQLLGRGVARVYAAARDPRTVDVHDPRVVRMQLDVTDPAPARPRSPPVWRSW